MTSLVIIFLRQNTCHKSLCNFNRDIGILKCISPGSALHRSQPRLQAFMQRLERRLVVGLVWGSAAYWGASQLLSPVRLAARGNTYSSNSSSSSFSSSTTTSTATGSTSPSLHPPLPACPPRFAKKEKEARRVIVVGDIHGCLEELLELLKKCEYEAEQDLLVLVGDLVGKGPFGSEVVSWARANNVACVMGNHDHYLLEHWRKGLNFQNIRHDTHRDAASKLSEADWQWLASLPYLFSLPSWNTLIVHAGVEEGIEWAEQRAKSLLNMRSILPNGESTKDGVGAPWASRWKGPAHIVFGHDARRGLQLHSHATGLDTGCCYGKQLSALMLPQQAIVSVPAKHTPSQSPKIDFFPPSNFSSYVIKFSENSLPLEY
eukprot:g30098.t1